jgi:intracellular septation protein
MALIAELGPLVSFFVAGQYVSFFAAVGVLMVTTVAAVGLSWRLDKRTPWLPIVSATFVLLGGFITLYFKNPDAIILADTLYYGTIAAVLGFALWRNNSLLQTLFGSIFALTQTGWKLLTWRWFYFLVLAALANEVARYLLTPDSWIEYRFYKSIIIIGFAVFQFNLSRQYRLAEVSNRWGLRTKPDSTTNGL